MRKSTLISFENDKKNPVVIKKRPTAFFPFFDAFSDNFPFLRTLSWDTDDKLLVSVASSFLPPGSSGIGGEVEFLSDGLASGMGSERNFTRLPNKSGLPGRQVQTTCKKYNLSLTRWKVINNLKLRRKLNNILVMFL